MGAHPRSQRDAPGPNGRSNVRMTSSAAIVLSPAASTLMGPSSMRVRPRIVSAIGEPACLGLDSNPASAPSLADVSQRLQLLEPLRVHVRRQVLTGFLLD